MERTAARTTARGKQRSRDDGADMENATHTHTQAAGPTPNPESKHQHEMKGMRTHKCGGGSVSSSNKPRTAAEPASQHTGIEEKKKSTTKKQTFGPRLRKKKVSP